MSGDILFTTKGLFGGAISMLVPTNYLDVSDLRPVPDNEEIYVDKAGDTSIIVNIAERPCEDDQEALKLHLDDSVEDDVPIKVWASKKLDDLPRFPSTTTAYTTLATVKPTRSYGNYPFVAVVVGLIRLTEQKADLVVTVNIPHNPEQAAEEKSIAAPGLEVDKMKSGEEWDDESAGNLLKESMKVAAEAIGSIHVQDWGLFGPGEV